MDAFPVVAVASPDPPRMVQEHEHVRRATRPAERLFEPRELLGAHALRGRLAKRALAGLRIALVGVQHDKPRTLVTERVPQRPEVLLVVALVLFRRSPFAAPIDVVVPRDREPRHRQLVHDALVLAHLRQPRLFGAVPLDQVAHRHHEVRLEQVDLGHRVPQDGDPFRRSARAVTEDRERERFVLVGKRELDGAGTVRPDPAIRVCVTVRSNRAPALRRIRRRYVYTRKREEQPTSDDRRRAHADIMRNGDAP